MPPRRKLTGAQARLFAMIGTHYIEAAQSECNDTPDNIPIFSWLSPLQRLKLVSEVMIGVLCENEPLPPRTIQHDATFCAMIEILFIELEVEEECAFDLYEAEIGEDLYLDDNRDSEFQKALKRATPETPEETAERKRRSDLIEHQAEKNMLKMKRKEYGEYQYKDEGHYNNDAHVKRMRDEIMEDLFKGPPISPQERKSMRPLTEDEEHAFRWRRACDAAFQEDFSFPFPLSAVDFDFRCTKKEKFYRALNLLFLTNLMEYKSETERRLIHGVINEYTYANSEKLPRIRTIERHVEVLRKTYESKWDPMKLAFDQRCLFAVCSNQIFCGHGQKEWCLEFSNRLQKNGIDIEKDGSYQARLDIFREMKDDYTEGLQFGYTSVSSSDAYYTAESLVPSKFVNEYLFEGVNCHGPGKNANYPYCFEQNNLMLCSRCQVARYCSADCQRRDWPKHKKQCAILAAESKDKKKMAKMAAKR